MADTSEAIATFADQVEAALEGMVGAGVLESGDQLRFALTLAAGLIARYGTEDERQRVMEQFRTQLEPAVEIWLRADASAPASKETH